MKHNADAETKGNYTFQNALIYIQLSETHRLSSEKLGYESLNLLILNVVVMPVGTAPPVEDVEESKNND